MLHWLRVPHTQRSAPVVPRNAMPPPSSRGCPTQNPTLCFPLFPLVCEYRAHQLNVIDLSAACIDIDTLQKLVDFLVTHFLAQVCQDISQLPYTNEACHVLVVNLE